MPKSLDSKRIRKKRGASQIDPYGPMSKHDSDSQNYTRDFSSDEGGFFVEWTAMKRWTADDIEEIGQDAVDLEVLDLAKEFMSQSLLRAHPEHKEGESDLGLWKPSDEYIKRNGKILVRTYRCPMWYRFGCGTEIRIQESPGGLLMQRLGTHNPYSHSDPDDTGPVTRFLRGKRLIPEADIPEAVEIRRMLGQSPRIQTITRTAVMQHRISSQNHGYTYQYIEEDEVPDLVASESGDEDEMPELRAPDSDDEDDDYFEDTRLNSHTTRNFSIRESEIEGDNLATFAQFCNTERETTFRPIAHRVSRCFSPY